MINYFKHIIIKVIYIFLLCVFLYRCATKKVIYSTYLYDKLSTEDAFNREKKAFRIIVPSGFSKRIIEGDHEKEFQLIYPDSSILYITNDHRSGSYTNWSNLKDIETKNYDFFYKDTVLYEGLNETGYWKEFKIKYVVIGYRGVPKEMREKYDAALESIK